MTKGMHIEFHRLVDELHDWCRKDMTQPVCEKCDGKTRMDALRWWVACRSSDEMRESMDGRDHAEMVLNGFPPLPTGAVEIACYMWDNWVEFEHESGYNEEVTSLLKDLSEFYNNE